jgi:hypothetical protein
VQLPIGMNTAEPWLLDAVDVQALLTGGQLFHGLSCSCRKLQQSAGQLFSSRLASSQATACLLLLGNFTLLPRAAACCCTAELHSAAVSCNYTAAARHAQPHALQQQYCRQ